MKTQNRRKIQTIVFATMLFALSFFISSYVGADSPVIAYADPSNAMYYAVADTDEGAGVAWQINVSDADTDLERVVLRENSSGTWSEFYDSGSLGGVSYHNTSGQNQNWTGSWTLYYWQICAQDGVDWYNTTYTFTTAYQWGEPKMVVFNDTQDHDFGFPTFIRNDTSDYDMVFYDRGEAEIRALNSSYGTDWGILDDWVYWTDSSTMPLNFIKYNGTSYLLTCDSTGDYDVHWWNGTGMEHQSTGIDCYDTWYSSYTRYSWGCDADAIYYDGKWNVVASVPQNGGPYLRHYIGTFPSNWTKIHDIDSLSQWSPSTAYYYGVGGTRLEILNGLLFAVYKDSGEDIRYATYDGVDWEVQPDVIYNDNEGEVPSDMELGVGDDRGCGYRGCSMVKDMINNQLVVVYVNQTNGDGPLDGALVYSVYNGTGWEGPNLIYAPIYGADISHPRAEFIDSRLTVAFSYNLRTENAIYSISAPGYTKAKSGLNLTYNRIQFPDASPTATNVNSTVFHLKNVDNRNITHIDWHFENIGDIVASSNLKIWTNMSGSWNGWTCDASGDIAEIDISGEMAGGLEWEKGVTTYWKLEILAVGGVAEDFHATDEDIFYKLTLA